MNEAFQSVKVYPKNDLLRYVEDKIKPSEQKGFLTIIRSIRARLGSTGDTLINDEELAKAFEGTRFHMLILDFRTEYELRTRSKSNRPPARTSPGVSVPNS